MSRRVSPTERIRAQIDELFASDVELAEVLEDVARLSVRLILQVVLEAEVTEWLGRPRYSHGERDREGQRNGYRPLTIKSTAGPIELPRPKLRGTDEAFASRLLGVGGTRTHALESLVIAGYVRGLSTRDVEAALGDALGPEATLSKSTVSRVCEAIKVEFDAWRRRDLSDLELDYLYLDGSNFKMHDGARAEPVLAAWGITTAGAPVLVALAPGGTESYDAWAGLLSELTERGLRAPLLGISDGAAGLIGAFEAVFDASLRQRCLVHRGRNILAKVPVEAQGEIKAAYWAIFNDIQAAPGDPAIGVARTRAAKFADRYHTRFPAAVECLERDFTDLTTHLRFPAEHWHRIRHSNFIERTFGEPRRRVKVIGRLPGERSCLSLVWAVLDRASRGWRGVNETPAGLRLLQDLRRQLLEPTTLKEITDETVTPAA